MKTWMNCLVLLFTLSLDATVSIQEYSEKIGSINPTRQSIRTLNHFGSAYCYENELTTAFLDFCREGREPKHVLEIGAGYGIKSSQIVQTGASLVINELSSEQLKCIKSAFQTFTLRDVRFGKCLMTEGSFIEKDLQELGGKPFDAILIESVLHFYDPETVVKALKRLHTFLKPRGRVYLLVSSPYLKYLYKAYEANRSQSSLWPGYFEDPESIDPNNRRLHKPYHVFDKETLQRELNLAGFSILVSKYIPRPHNEIDMALDNREGLIVVAEKIEVYNAPPNHLFKIISQENWQKSQTGKCLQLDKMDDLFIHLATEEQLERILGKFWSGRSDYVILKLDLKKLTGNLVHEANPGGENKYYHLYEGCIPLEAVLEVN